MFACAYGVCASNCRSRGVMLASVDGESVVCMQPPNGSMARTNRTNKDLGTAGPDSDSSTPSNTRCCQNRAENKALRNNCACLINRVPSPQTAQERRTVSMASPCFGQTRLDSCVMCLGLGELDGHLRDLLAPMRTANTSTTQQLGFKTPRLQRS